MQEFHLETIGPSSDCAVLQVTGEIDVYTAPILRERIRDLAAKGAVQITAARTRVDFLAPPGRGVLVGGQKRPREPDGSPTPVTSPPPTPPILEPPGLPTVSRHSPQSQTRSQ